MDHVKGHDVIQDCRRPSQPAGRSDGADHGDLVAVLLPRLKRRCVAAWDVDPSLPSLDQLWVMVRVHEGTDYVSALAAGCQMMSSPLIDQLAKRGWVSRAAAAVDPSLPTYTSAPPGPRR